MGPFSNPPFREWSHVAPLMTRPKRDTQDRRVISDLTFPDEVSVNAYIIKNSLYGIEREHSLPNIDGLVEDLRAVGGGAYMATLDIAHAYKNFRSDPLDWPLQCIKWDNKLYCEVAMPFGARASSYHMQRIALAIVKILQTRGVNARMYLDDLIILSHSRAQADRDFKCARQLFRDLGLPEALDKAQPPAQKVKWLGVHIDAANLCISMPTEKIQQVTTRVNEMANRRSTTRHHLQSLLGLILHVSKCVRPARIFVGRLLEALRGAKGKFCNVNASMRADFAWFQEFLQQWNGVSVIPPSTPNREILVDACPTGVGGADQHRIYTGRVCPLDDPVANITELEAANVVVALHTLLIPEDAGSHVRVWCDNVAAVHALRTGRCKNKVLMESARAVWMVQALLDVQISFEHIPGRLNTLADALSRAHLAPKFYNIVQQYIVKFGLKFTDPCLFSLNNVEIHSRSGHRVAAPESTTETTTGKGPGDTGQPGNSGEDIRGIRQEGRDGPSSSTPKADVCIPGVLGNTHTGASVNPQPCVTHSRLSPPSGGRRGSYQAHQNTDGPGSNGQKQVVPDQGETTYPNCHTQASAHRHPRHTYRECRDSGAPPPILWGFETVGGGPPFSGQVQPHKAPHSGGRQTATGAAGHYGKIRKEPPKDGPKEVYVPPARRGLSGVPSRGRYNRLTATTDQAWRSAHVHVPKPGPNHRLHNKENLGTGTQSYRPTVTAVHTAQHPQDLSHTGLKARLYGLTDTEIRWLEV